MAKDTKTFQNLMNAFAGESQAFQRYTMYAKIAKKDGYNNIKSIFEETAANERMHARLFYDLLSEMVGEENMPETMGLTAEYPIARKSTYDNLMFAANGEHEEFDDYNEMAKTAEEEGFPKASMRFKMIADIEKHHGDRYEKIANLLKVEELMHKSEDVYWKCDVCGHIHYGAKAPAACPVCAHGNGHFELNAPTI
ncbi:MAG: rubrerythrin [Mycoplasmatales bacterium]